ncbi:MAG TPA: hypothetical protein DEB73_03795 [Candidatus Magasanikbacteria bacterium]|nr:hypothetical protein [Candidatus Magasanikbacteria bacterium]
MTDVLKIGKKALTVSVVFTTILWSIGFAALVAPLVVKADVALVAGDVIQGTSTKNVFYYSADGKRYTFPTDKVFFSWYKDWSMVKKIPDAQMGNITIGGTVAYKAGTQLVKIQTDPKVYAVEPGGSIRWVETEAIAVSLYGSDWAKKVHDVDPTIFPYVYKVGSSVNTASYPVGALVKVGSDYFYVNAANSKQKVSADVLTANGFQTKYAVTAANLDGYTAGTDMATDVALKTVAGTGSAVVVGGGTTVVAGSGLTVALAADTPVAATIVTDSTNTTDGAQALIPAMKLNFTAAADGDVKVKTVKLTRTGISADTDVVNMYLYDGDTQLASSPSIATKVFTFNNSSGLFTVSKGTTKVITVKFDLKNSASAGITVGFQVVALGDIVTDGAAVTGNFPVQSNTMTGATVTDLGQFALANVSPTADADVDPGQVGYEIWRFTATTQSQDVELRSIKFTLIGSFNIADLKNFALYDGGTQIGTTVADIAADKTVTIKPAVPYAFTKGTVKTLSLKADIVSGSTRTFRASLQNAGDLIIYDKGYGVFLKHNGLDSFAVVSPGAGIDYTIASGSLSMSVAVDSPTGNIASSTTGVLLSKFNVKANGEDVKITTITVDCTNSTSARTLVNLKVLADGTQIGTTQSSLACDGTDWAPTFGSTWIVRAGTTSVLTIKADITGSSSAAQTVHADVAGGTAQGLTSLNAPTVSALVGRTLTIAAGTLSVSKNSSFGNKISTNPTGTVNGAGVKIGSFVVNGGAGEDAEVSQIAVVDVSAGETASTHYNASLYLQNLKLMHGATQLGAVLSNPASGASAVQSHTFNISPVITIKAGEQYVVDVVADIKSNSQTAASPIVNFDSVTASGKLTGTAASYSTDVTLQNTYIATAGSLTVAIDSDTPLPTNLLMGAPDQTLAKFKLTADPSENINITELVLSNAVMSGATGTLSNIRLYDENGVQIGQAINAFNSAQTSNTLSTTTYAGANFSGFNYVVPANQSKVITVKADLTTYQDLGVTATGKAFQLALVPDYDGTTSGVQLPITATGAQSGATSVIAVGNFTATSDTAGTTTPLTLEANGTTTQVAAVTGQVRANEFVLYRVKLAIAWASDAPSGASSPNAAQTIAKFTIQNMANAGGYVATVFAVNFSISTTISNTADRVLTIYKDSLSTASLGTTTFITGATIAKVMGNTNFVDGNMTNVEISSGSSKTFFVTLDTTDAASTKSLSITIPNSHVSMAVSGTGATRYGILWGDGVSGSTTIVGNDRQLPLAQKTLTY